jgi:PAS domain-containing protein
VIATVQVQEFEEEIPAHGEMRTFGTIKFPLLDEGGQPYALCAIANDVTERRATEDALRDRDAYNKVLFEQSHVPIVVMDPGTRRFVDCNQAAVAIYGYDSKEDVIGKTPLDVSAPQQPDGSDARPPWTCARAWRCRAARPNSNGAIAGRTVKSGMRWCTRRPSCTATKYW